MRLQNQLQIVTAEADTQVKRMTKMGMIREPLFVLVSGLLA